MMTTIYRIFLFVIICLAPSLVFGVMGTSLMGGYANSGKGHGPFLEASSLISIYSPSIQLKHLNNKTIFNLGMGVVSPFGLSNEKSNFTIMPRASFGFGTEGVFLKVDTSFFGGLLHNFFAPWREHNPSFFVGYEGYLKDTKLNNIYIGLAGFY